MWTFLRRSKGIAGLSTSKFQIHLCETLVGSKKADSFLLVYAEFQHASPVLHSGAAFALYSWPSDHRWQLFGDRQDVRSWCVLHIDYIVLFSRVFLIGRCLDVPSSSKNSKGLAPGFKIQAVTFAGGILLIDGERTVIYGYLSAIEVTKYGWYR